MAVCAAYRIPHSLFLRDWTATDRDKAIWHQIRQAETCSGCGTHPDEWDVQLGGSPNAYRAEEVICRGCRAIQQAQDRSGKNGSVPKGSSIALKRREATDGGHHGAGRQPG